MKLFVFLVICGKCKEFEPENKRHEQAILIV